MMMGESASHLHLVQELAKALADKYCEGNLYRLTIDNVDVTSSGKPPSINGHVPDVYVAPRDNKPEVIGEAKPAQDIEAKRSRMQYEAWLLHAGKVGNCELVVATPWHCVPKAINLFLNLRKRLGLTQVVVHVINNLGDLPR